MKTWTLVAALVLTTSCAVEEIVAAEADGPPDDGHHQVCMSNFECRADEYCAKPSCQSTMGGCTRRPTVCGANLEARCGCNGVTYFNDCWRMMARSASSSPGECDSTAMECGAGLPCPPTLHCAQLLPDPSMTRCSPDITGRCWGLPPQCDPNAPGDTQRWFACGAPGPCVDTCTAIRSSEPHWLAQICP